MESDTENKDCFVTQLERFLVKNFLFSSSFDDISQGKHDRRQRVKNLLVILFLVVQTARYAVILSFDIFMEADLEMRNTFGSIYYFMGVGEKILFSASFTTTLQSLWIRMLCLYKEENNDLHFLRDIHDYRLDNHETPLLTGKFREEFLSMAQGRIKKIKARRCFLLTLLASSFYTFTALYCISLEKSFSFKRYIFWIFYSFLTWIHIRVTVVMVFTISGLWHISRYHCQLLTKQLIQELERIIHRLNWVYLKESTDEFKKFMKMFKDCQERIKQFNRFSKHFVTCIAVSSSFITSLFMLTVIRSESATASRIFFPAACIMSFEPLSVMATSTSLYSLSMKMYQRLNDCFIRLHWRSFIRQRMAIRSLIKDVSNPQTNSLTLVHRDNTACRPIVFLQFIGSGVTLFILLLEFVDSCGSQLTSQ